MHRLRSNLPAVLLAAAFFSANRPCRADLAPRQVVTGGTDVVDVEIVSGSSRTKLRWSDLSTHKLSPGNYTLQFAVPPLAEALEIPVCAGRGVVRMGDKALQIPSREPTAVAIPPAKESRGVQLRISVSPYEQRIACGRPARSGSLAQLREGLLLLPFASPHRGANAGKAAVFVPFGHDVRKPTTLLVGTHPWNGDIWTYAAYRELLEEAQRRDVVLLFPSGLGNSLYMRDAEREVLLAIDALSREIQIDPRAISIWGASMGGAGATTIGFHHPERFALIASFFGDSKYNISTYVRSLMPTEADAHQVNALDIADNARNSLVWLFHGEADRVSPVAQSDMLANALKQRGFAFRYERVAERGHEGLLVTRYIEEIVREASQRRSPSVVSRVTYQSARAEDESAYGITFRRSGSKDAFIDIERMGDRIVVHTARNVTSLAIPKSTFGFAPTDLAPLSRESIPGSIAIDLR